MDTELNTIRQSASAEKVIADRSADVSISSRTLAFATGVKKTCEPVALPQDHHPDHSDDSVVRRQECLELVNDFLTKNVARHLPPSVALRRSADAVRNFSLPEERLSCGVQFSTLFLSVSRKLQEVETPWDSMSALRNCEILRGSLCELEHLDLRAAAQSGIEKTRHASQS